MKGWGFEVILKQESHLLQEEGQGPKGTPFVEDEGIDIIIVLSQDWTHGDMMGRLKLMALA